MVGPWWIMGPVRARPTRSWLLGAALLLLVAIDLPVARACLPPGPFGDHATFLAQVVAAEVDWLAWHGPHRVVGSRVLAAAELPLGGATWLAPLVSSLSLAGLALFAGGRARWAALLAALLLLRLPTVAALSLSTNVQFPVALFLGATGAWCLVAPARPGRTLLGLGLVGLAPLWSAEGVLAVPIAALVVLWRHRDVHRAGALLALAVAGVGVWMLGLPVGQGVGLAGSGEALLIHAGSPWVSSAASGRGLGVAALLITSTVALGFGPRAPERHGGALILGLFGIGTLCLLALGRRNPDLEAFRYTLAPSVLMLGATLALGFRLPRLQPVLLLVVSVGVLLEAGLRQSAHVESCTVVGVESRAFWSGASDDASRLLPQAPAEARALRDNLHHHGLYILEPPP